MLQRRHFLQLGVSAIASKTRRAKWVKTDSLSDLPTPKFWFGDWVYDTHVCDDELDPDNLGREYRDYGVVHGLSFHSDESEHPGWVYLIHWRLLDGQPAPPGYKDELQESYLNFLSPGASGVPRCR